MRPNGKNERVHVFIRSETRNNSQQKAIISGRFIIQKHHSRFSSFIIVTGKQNTNIHIAYTGEQNIVHKYVPNLAAMYIEYTAQTPK